MATYSGFTNEKWINMMIFQSYVAVYQRVRMTQGPRVQCHVEYGPVLHGLVDEPGLLCQCRRLKKSQLGHVGENITGSSHCWHLFSVSMYIYAYYVYIYIYRYVCISVCVCVSVYVWICMHTQYPN